jgi:hypothetical protein
MPSLVDVPDARHAQRRLLSDEAEFSSMHFHVAFMFRSHGVHS